MFCGRGGSEWGSPEVRNAECGIKTQDLTHFSVPGTLGQAVALRGAEVVPEGEVVLEIVGEVFETDVYGLAGECRKVD